MHLRKYVRLFRPHIPDQIAKNSSQDSFTQVVTNSMSRTLTALKNAFASQKVAAEIRIGETGWPTRGSQPALPKDFLASTQQAQWYYEATKSWSLSTGIKTILFEAYDEPWKGSQDAANSEAFFGIWHADGTSSARNQYTLKARFRSTRSVLPDMMPKTNSARWRTTADFKQRFRFREETMSRAITLLRNGVASRKVAITLLAVGVVVPSVSSYCAGQEAGQVRFVNSCQYSLAFNSTGPR
jgi:hypothetical protein